MRIRLPRFLLPLFILFIAGCAAPPPPGPDCSATPCVALTIDDGPNRNTAQVLDILAAYNAKATFFVVGSRVEAAPELVARMVAEGHEVGNHSWSHIPFPRLPEAQILAELENTNAAVSAATEGYTPQLFRPPYGSYSPRVAAIVPYAPVLWTIDTGDWEAAGYQEIVRHVRQKSGPGSVILMHGFTRKTVRALPEILQNLVDRGFTFVTVSQLLARRP